MRKKKLILSVLLLLATYNLAKGQEIIYSKADSLIYENYIRDFKEKRDKPVNGLIVETAKYFLGKPYVESTLEVSDKEKLVINLSEFDCTTFVENCIALSNTIRTGDLSFDNYCKLLTSLRYRNSIVDNYISRLHYTTDWIYENERKKILSNISEEIGGKKISKPVNFMSTHPQLYKQLKNNPQNTKELSDIENNINKRNSYSILTLAALTQNETKIKDGDIIVFATSISGLDYSHIGIAYRQKDGLHFIHASSRMKKAVIEKKTLLEYCRDSKNCTGITVIRVN